MREAENTQVSMVDRFGPAPVLRNTLLRRRYTVWSRPAVVGLPTPVVIELLRLPGFPPQ